MSESKLGPRNFLGWANDKIAFALCALAGLRAGEVSALRWDNVDLAKAQIKIVDDVGSNSRIESEATEVESGRSHGPDLPISL